MGDSNSLLDAKTNLEEHNLVCAGINRDHCALHTSGTVYQAAFIHLGWSDTEGTILCTDG